MADFVDVDYRIKVAVVGQEASGKSSLINCFSGHTVSEGVLGGNDVIIKLLRLHTGELVQVQVWDTVDQPSSRRSLAPHHYRGADGVVIVYDVTTRNPLVKVRECLKEVRTHTKGSDVVVFVAGTKRDLENKNKHSIETLQKTMAAEADGFFETSSVTGENVTELFQTMAELLVARRSLGLGRSSRPHSIRLGQDPEAISTRADKQRRKCCS